MSTGSTNTKQRKKKRKKTKREIQGSSYMKKRRGNYNNINLSWIQSNPRILTSLLSHLFSLLSVGAHSKEEDLWYLTVVRTLQEAFLPRGNPISLSKIFSKIYPKPFPFFSSLPLGQASTSKLCKQASNKLASSVLPSCFFHSNIRYCRIGTLSTVDLIRFGQVVLNLVLNSNCNRTTFQKLPRSLQNFST